MNLQTAFKEFAGKEIGVSAMSWMQRGHRYYFGELNGDDTVVQRLRQVFPKCLETGHGDGQIELTLGAPAEDKKSIVASIDRGTDGKWRFGASARPA